MNPIQLTPQNDSPLRLANGQRAGLRVIPGLVDGPDEEGEADIDLVLGLGGTTDGEGALYDQAVAVVLKDRKISSFYLQRKLGIGYKSAARLVEQMEEEGLLSPANHVGKREILVPDR